MTEDNKSKVRIRFQNGAEFEAEGTQAFIEQQRNYFLNLIGKQAPQDPRPKTPTPSAFVPQNDNFLPAQTSQTASFQTSAPQPDGHLELEVPPPYPYIWEKLLREDGQAVYLRRKYKLTPVENVCLLLAGARVLLKRGEMSALDLARCLKESHISLPGRLDRVLGGYIKQGYLVCQGAKRSRTYKLTDSGFARTFVLAEKLAKEI